MSIELMKRALEFITGVYFGEHEGSRADREKLEADLTTAIQQAEAQQPATRLPEDVVIGHVTLCKGSNISLLIDHAKRLNADVERLEAQQPATGEPVQAERDQLRCAQADAVMPLIGPLLDAWENADREVISQEPELSRQLKAINNAMEGAQPTTPKPVVVQHRKPFIGWKGETRYTAWMDGKGLDGWPHRELYDHPAPSAPADLVHLRNALILAANRLERLTLELKYDSQARADAIEWASDAMLAAKDSK